MQKQIHSVIWSIIQRYDKLKMESGTKKLGMRHGMWYNKCGYACC